MHVFIIPILRFASLFKQQTSFEQAKKRKSLILREKLVQQHIRNEFSKTLLRPPPW